MINDKKKTKAQLIEELVDLREFKRRHELIGAITEQVSDSVIATNMNFEIIYTNRAFRDLYGYDAEEMVGRTPAFLNAEALGIDIQRDIYETVASGDIWCGTVLNRRKDGGTFNCDLAIFPLVNEHGDIFAYAGTQSDVTEREQVEAKLRESEERFRNLAQMLPEAVFETDENLNVIYANQRAFDLLGYSPDDLSDGLHAFELLAPGDRDRARTNFTKRVGGLTPGVTEYQALRKDGSTFPMLFHASSNIKNGGLHGLRGVIVDITERKRAEADLLRFKLGIERCDEAIFITDPEGVFLYVNPAFEKIYGFAQEEVLGNTPRILKSGAIAQEVYEQFWKTLVSKAVVAGEIVNKTKNGCLISMYGTANPILDDENNIIGYLAIQRDITEQKRAERDRLALEAQVQQAQKLESLGVLAGGIAHDFNNLLMGVLGNAEMALADLSPASAARGSIEGVQEAAKRAAELAHQMLAYSGKGQFVVKPVGLSEVVKDIGSLSSAAVSKKTTLRYQLDDSIPAIEADVAQLRQVVLNLITNAAEALEDQSGIVTVATGVMDFHSNSTEIDLAAGELSEGFYAYLEVTDTGVGMDKATASKMFDPFFTTKFTGRGLGLAALFGIVRGHKGAIQVVSELNEGTTIKVFFPTTEKPAESLRDNGVAEVNSPAHGTILLVDDEPTVLDVGARMLKKAGYEVRTARDGSEAIEMFKKHLKDIDGVILDLMMPNMDGEEAFGELQNISRDVPVLLSSGYSIGDVEARISTKGFAGFLQKPYRMNSLMQALREAL